MVPPAVVHLEIPLSLQRHLRLIAFLVSSPLAYPHGPFPASRCLPPYGRCTSSRAKSRMGSLEKSGSGAQISSGFTGHWPQYPRTIPCLSIRKNDGRVRRCGREARAPRPTQDPAAGRLAAPRGTPPIPNSLSLGAARWQCTRRVCHWARVALILPRLSRHRGAAWT
jgi:hypothetical protein